MSESIISWSILLLMFLVFFIALRKRKRKDIQGSDTLFRIIGGGLCLVTNVLLSILVYSFIMATFEIPTGGFLNFNELFVFVGCWAAVALIGIAWVRSTKKRLQRLYKTILFIQTTCFVLPFLVLFIFLAFASLK